MRTRGGRGDQLKAVGAPDIGNGYEGATGSDSVQDASTQRGERAGPHSVFVSVDVHQKAHDHLPSSPYTKGSEGRPVSATP